MLPRLPALVLVLLFGCAEPAGLKILRIPVPTASTCTLTATSNDVYLTGYFDPLVAPSYQLAVAVRNDLGSPETQPSTIFGQNFRTQTNDIFVTGFESCWYLANAAIGNNGSGFVDCDDLPSGQRGFASGAGTIPEGGAPALASANVLTVESLQAPGIFGDTFKATDLVSATLILQFRVVGSTGAGNIERSTWFQIPISIVSNHNAQCNAAKPNSTAADADGCGVGITPDRSCT